MCEELLGRSDCREDSRGMSGEVLEPLRRIATAALQLAFSSCDLLASAAHSQSPAGDTFSISELARSSRSATRSTS